MATPPVYDLFWHPRFWAPGFWLPYFWIGGQLDFEDAPGTGLDALDGRLRRRRRTLHLVR